MSDYDYALECRTNTNTGTNKCLSKYDVFKVPYRTALTLMLAPINFCRNMTYLKYQYQLETRLESKVFN